MKKAGGFCLGGPFFFCIPFCLRRFFGSFWFSYDGTACAVPLGLEFVRAWLSYDVFFLHFCEDVLGMAFFVFFLEMKRETVQQGRQAEVRKISVDIGSKGCRFHES